MNEFIKPEIEVLNFKSTDIITTSGGGSGSGWDRCNVGLKAQGGN